MEFKFHIPTKVIFGCSCVSKNGSEFAKLGTRAFIVTGRYSARASGALDDLQNILEQEGIKYHIYDEIENNPSLESVGRAAKSALDFKPDFVVGIGGGSPLDAAKAVAVLAVNNIEPVELYRNEFIVDPLPIVAIPTTAGTGSEVTPYSILTRSDLQTKMSFGNEHTFPRLAFMDAAYTMSLPYDVTVNTAVDALSHAIEGYICRRNAPMSDILAERSIEMFGECVGALEDNRMSFEVKEKLLYMAMLAGMVISHTGTTIVHGLGYSLTYFKKLPHGKANGVLLSEYLRFNFDSIEMKIQTILKLLKLSSISDFKALMDRLMPDRPVLSSQEVEMYSALAMEQKSTANNIRTVNRQDLEAILMKSLENRR